MILTTFFTYLAGPRPEYDLPTVFTVFKAPSDFSVYITFLTRLRIIHLDMIFFRKCFLIYWRLSQSVESAV
jgi:hypothetical protein